MSEVWLFIFANMLFQPTLNLLKFGFTLLFEPSIFLWCFRDFVHATSNYHQTPQEVKLCLSKLDITLFLGCFSSTTAFFRIDSLLFGDFFAIRLTVLYKHLNLAKFNRSDIFNNLGFCWCYPYGCGDEFIYLVHISVFFSWLFANK